MKSLLFLVMVAERSALEGRAGYHRLGGTHWYSAACPRCLRFSILVHARIFFSPGFARLYTVCSQPTAQAPD